MSDGQFDIPNIDLDDVETPGANHWCLIRDSANGYALTVVYGDPKQSYVIPEGAPVEISPPALAVNTDDWSPDNIASATVILLEASVPVDLTGIDSDGLAPNAKRKTLINVGTQPITLKNEIGSALANQFKLVGSGDILLQGRDTQDIYYDETASAWRSV